MPIDINEAINNKLENMSIEKLKRLARVSLFKNDYGYSISTLRRFDAHKTLEEVSDETGISIDEIIKYELGEMTPNISLSLSKYYRSLDEPDEDNETDDVYYYVSGNE